MAFFDNLTTSLKQKWLQFFQDNRSWIALQMEVEAVFTPDGGKRPSSYFILGVINALEPELGQLMLPFSQLNPDADALIEVLELNFDPETALGKSLNRSSESPEISDAQVAQDDYGEIVMDLLTEDEMADQLLLVESDDESILVLSAAEAQALDNMSLDEIAQAIGLTEDEETFETMSAAQPNEMGELLSDVWAEETSSKSELADKTDLGKTQFQ